MNPGPGAPFSSIQHGRNIGVSTAGNAETERDLEVWSSGSGEDASVRGRLDCREEGIELGARFFVFVSSGAADGSCGSVTRMAGGDLDFFALCKVREGWWGSLRFLLSAGCGGGDELDGVEAAESGKVLSVNVDAKSAACCSFQARRVVT
jgi:hypothetical protein